MTQDKATPASVTRRDHESLVAYALASDLQNDPLVIDLCTALAAERDRADRAEARIEKAPHGSRCSLMRGVPIPVNCDCWKSEATA